MMSPEGNRASLVAAIRAGPWPSTRPLLRQLIRIDLGREVGPGIGYPLNPLILPVLGEKPGREEQLEEGLK